MRVLALECGFMLGSFGGGVLWAWREAGLDEKSFDIYAGSSAGAWNIAFFVADQMDAGLRMWTKHMPNGFLRYGGARGVSCDMQYLNRVLRYEEFLRCDAFAACPSPIYVALSNAETGEAEYVLLNDISDPILILLASSRMPYVCERIEGVSDVYYDGGLIAPIPICPPFMTEDDTLVIITSAPSGFRIESFFWKLASMLRWKDPGVKRLIANRPRHTTLVMEAIEQRRNTIVIRPPQKLPIGWLTQDPKRIEAAVEIGKQVGRDTISLFT